MKVLLKIKCSSTSELYDITFKKGKPNTRRADSKTKSCDSEGKILLELRFRDAKKATVTDGFLMALLRGYHFDPNLHALHFHKVLNKKTITLYGNLHNAVEMLVAQKLLDKNTCNLLQDPDEEEMIYLLNESRKQKISFDDKPDLESVTIVTIPEKEDRHEHQNLNAPPPGTHVDPS